jgi:catechol 2,3-dioxygenase-like lactoylglutathione lyase family enzyme
MSRLVGFGLTTQNAESLAIFYETAFGAHRISSEQLSDAAFKQLMNVECGAKRIWLALGNEKIELLEFEKPGEPYPEGVSSSDLLFQHFAIVVEDMSAAYEKLSTIEGWSPISTGGPVVLPQSSGGITAFKFRDPDGHPLELIAFPAGRVPDVWKRRAPALCFGIDHSAICVSNTRRSANFYRTLGFQIAAQTLNTGPEQERLDSVADPHVEVTALAAMEPTPHIELLCYNEAPPRPKRVLRRNDVAATRLLLKVDEETKHSDDAHGALDPDGHHLILTSEPEPSRCHSLPWSPRPPY